MEPRTRPETAQEYDVIDLLLRQHTLIRQLFNELDRSHGDERRDAFSRLARLLTVHETAEQEIVHPYARRKLVGGDTIIDSRLQEEEEATRMLARLDDLDSTSAEFTRELERLRAAVFAHVAAEERYEFSELRAATNAAERKAMGVGVKAAEALAPAHPVPGSTAKDILVGPPVAIMNRAREVIRKAMGTSGSSGQTG